MNIYQRNLDLIVEEIDNELLILDVNNGKYFALNSVSNDIWKILENPLNVNEIISELTKIYDVDYKKCEEDTFVAIKKMLRLKIINVFKR
ncbi:MAG: PqqD family protein [Flavobacteriia bacterium]|nr:PqqD family protein [Flavobacteriia bacterium]